MTAGGPPHAPYPPAQRPMPPRPPKPKRPVSRLVAGLLWLVAAGVTTGGLIADDAVSRASSSGRIELFNGFWSQYQITEGRTTQGPDVYFGVVLVVAAVFLLLAFVVTLVSERKWAATVAGAFGTAMLVAEAMQWLLRLSIDQPGGSTSGELGLWLLVGAAVLGLAGLGTALAERAMPVLRPAYGPPRMPMPPPPPPQPRWEPQTPPMGIPVQHPPTPTPDPPTTPEPPTTAEPPAVPEQPVPEQPAPQPPRSHLDQPEPTSAIAPPDPPEPGSISRKLDGDEK